MLSSTPSPALRLLAAVLSITAAAGCASAPCTDYLDAQQECYDTLGETNPLAEKNAYCRDFTADAEPYFTCLADAYRGADCTTEDGFSDAVAAAAACSQ